MNDEDLVAYYFGFPEGSAYFDNRARLWLSWQLNYLELQPWCYKLDYWGA